MVEDWGVFFLSWVERVDVEEVRNQQVESIRLPCATGNGGYVIWYWEGRGHIIFRIHLQEGSLVKSDDGDLEAGVGQYPPRIGVLDQYSDNVWRPGVTPNGPWDGSRGIQLNNSCTDDVGVE